MIFQRSIVARLTREQWILLALAAAGALLRVEYLREFSILPHYGVAVGPDVMEYDVRARELLNGRIFPAAPEIHGPLYSWFLAGMYRLTGNSIGAVRSVQVFLNFAAYLVMGELLRRLGAGFKVRAAFLAAALLTPVMIFHQAELVSETLLAPLTAVTLWLLAAPSSRAGRSFGAGLGLGALILTHGLMLFFASAELLYLFCRRRWRAAALLTAGIAVLTLPVIAAKSRRYGHWEFIQANGMYNLWIGHNPAATGGCYLRPGKMWRGPLEAARDAAARRGVSESRVFLERIGRFYRETPGRAALLPLRKLARILAPHEPIAGADPERLIRATPLQQLGAGAMAAVILLALYGVGVAVRRRLAVYAHFYLLAGAVTAGMLLTVAAGRYRQGMMPGVFLLAALGAAELGRKTGVLVATCLLIGLFGAPLLWEHRAAEAAAIIGEARFRIGDLNGAEAPLLRAERAIDDPARFDNLLGAIAEKRGDFPVAEARYRRVIAADPEFPDAWLNLGHLYFHRPGRREEALRLIRAALDRDPDLPSAHNLLGLDAAERRDYPTAERRFLRAVRLAPGRREYELNLSACRNLINQTDVKEGK